MNEQPEPTTATGRLFQALGRADSPQIGRWRQVLENDAVGLEELPLMTEYAMVELLAASPRKLRVLDIARIHRTLNHRGLAVSLRDVQRVLDSASGRSADLSVMAKSQLIRIRVAAYPLIAKELEILDPQLTASVVRAEKRLKDFIKQWPLNGGC